MYEIKKEKVLRTRQQLQLISNNIPIIEEPVININKTVKPIININKPIINKVVKQPLSKEEKIKRRLKNIQDYLGAPVKTN